MKRMTALLLALVLVAVSVVAFAEEGSSVVAEKAMA